MAKPFECSSPETQLHEQIAEITKAFDHAQARLDMIGWLFVAVTGPLPTIGRVRIGRVKTMPDFIPTGSQPKQEMVADFKRHQLELTRMARECDGLAIDKVRIRSPFGEKIQYNVYLTFRILPRHEERHIDQAFLVWA